MTVLRNEAEELLRNGCLDTRMLRLALRASIEREHAYQAEMEEMSRAEVINAARALVSAPEGTQAQAQAALLLKQLLAGKVGT